MPSSRIRIFGLTIERASEEHALALAAREGRAHVADQRQILHRRAHDVGMHVAAAAAAPRPAACRDPGSKPEMLSAIVPESRRSSCATTPTALAPGAPALRRRALTVQLDRAVSRIVEPEQQLEQRGLAAA